MCVKTAFFLALRPGQVELFSLTWDAFDWRRGLVVIHQGKSGRFKTVVPHPAYMAEAKIKTPASHTKPASILWNGFADVPG